MNLVRQHKWRFFADISPSKATCNICHVPGLLQRLKVNYLRLLVFAGRLARRRLRCSANCFHFLSGVRTELCAWTFVPFLSFCGYLFGVQSAGACGIRFWIRIFCGRDILIRFVKSNSEINISSHVTSVDNQYQSI